MGLKGDFVKLRKLRRSLKELAKPDGSARTAMAKDVATEIKGLVREEFTTGEGPEGPWPDTVRGKRALVSRKYPNAYQWRYDRGRLRFVARSTRGSLVAHQFGHKFPARRVAAHRQFLTFSKAGKLIRQRRAFNKKGEARRGVFQTFARAHTVRARYLPPRPSYPVGALPPKWRTAIERGARTGMQRWHDRALE